jgi:hypothetical protein
MIWLHGEQIVKTKISRVFKVDGQLTETDHETAVEHCDYFESVFFKEEETKKT